MLCIVEELREKTESRHVARRVGVSPGRQDYQHSVTSPPVLVVVCQRSVVLLNHGYRLHLTQGYTAHRLMGSLLFLHRGARYRWGECASEWTHHRVCFFLSTPRPGVLNNTGCLDLLLMARFRTATHHNMMLDPAILCLSSRFIAVAFVDVTQRRRFLTTEYYTIGAKVVILLFTMTCVTG
jgi:hypothetical protein